mmetsp:Transcript_39241/g.121649  ORF Transcript_39241/g.121649 Transcript_39241/m.121649 type:complete len:984 (+) Transcript_39241:416-3367(+)
MSSPPDGPGPEGEAASGRGAKREVPIDELRFSQASIFPTVSTGDSMDDFARKLLASGWNYDVPAPRAVRFGQEASGGSGAGPLVLFDNRRGVILKWLRERSVMKNALIQVFGPRDELLEEFKSQDHGLRNMRFARALGAEQLRAAAARVTSMLLELVPDRPDLTDPVIANIEQDRVAVMAILTATSLMRGVPPQVLELVAGLGEVWSAQTLTAYLKSTGSEADWVDAREVLIVPDSGAGSGLGEKGVATDTIAPFWDETEERLQAWWGKAFAGGTDAAPFLVITGFVCSTPSGRPTTLKRSGSDYSATIFAKVLGASKVIMWKNVDGVYTADPRLVPAAFPVARMTFDEAMELAYFGGQVLHPSAMVPCIEKRIPVLVRNVFNPAHPGTRVYGRGDDCFRWPDQEDDDDGDFPVKALTSIEKVALVTLAGANFLGTPGVARRMMEALCTCGVNVILTSQGSSEHSITVAVEERDMQPAVDSVEQAFALELARDSEIRVTSKPGVSILAVIGEGMKSRPGIGGRFLNSLGKAKVNVIAIAQGSSERNISTVVAREDLSRALRAAHAGFTLSDMTVAVGIIGSGKVGTELLKQLNDFQKNVNRKVDLPALKEIKGLNIEVRAFCDEKKMVLADRGLPLDCICKSETAFQPAHGGAICDVQRWEEALQAEGTAIPELLRAAATVDGEFSVGATDLAALEEFMDTKRIPHKVLIDCTASEEVAALYPRWLQRGLHVISPNKRAGAGPLPRYHEIMKAASPEKAQWHYESTVGGLMPVISLIHDLMQTGDRVTKVEGSFSATMSYVFNTMNANPELALSEVVKGAEKNGLTEPNPLEDLDGMDTARKALIIARELGMKLELEDVQTESVLPEGTDISPPPPGESAADRLVGRADDELAEKLKEAKEKGEHLAYVGTVDAEAGTVSVGLRCLPLRHPLSTTCEADCAVSLVTQRYPASTPLVVRGPGAGAVVTASGVVADLLRLSKTLG